MSFVEQARAYITSKSTIDTHKKKQKVARDWLLANQQETGDKTYEEGGYKCTLSHIHKEGVDSDALKKKNPELHDKCQMMTLSLRKSVVTPEIQELIDSGVIKAKIYFDESILEEKLNLEEVTPDDLQDCITTLKDEWRVRVTNGN